MQALQRRVIALDTNSGFLPASRKGLVFLGVSLALLLSTVSCWRSPASVTNSSGSPASMETVKKPSPRVVDISASTTGTQDDYYVILNSTVGNDGTTGTVLVIATVTQANNTIKKQAPVSLNKGEKRVVQFIFPIKWQGGEWTAKVTAEVP